MKLNIKNPNDLPTVSIKELIPTQGELKDLTEANYNKLKLSLEKHGFIFPISIWQNGDKNYLIDGHQRQRVIVKEYGDVEVPIIKIPAKDITEAAEILLKVTSQYGTITQQGLDTYIATYELPEVEVYEATHYDAISYLQQEPEVEEDEAPEVDDKEPPKSKLGEVYQLGRHRVMCGDSTDKASVELLMDGAKADMVFTDPPYGMDLDTDYSSMVGGKHLSPDKQWTGGNNYGKVIGDDKPFNYQDYAWLEAKEQFWWGADYYFKTLPDEGNLLVWDKRLEESLDKAVGSGFELCWSKEKHKKEIVRIKWAGYFGTETQDIRKRVHPTQKPIELAGWFINKFSRENNIILDLFGGSGSTLIACEQTDRTCYGMELDPKYVDVIRKRYTKFTNDNELPDNWEDLTPAVKEQ